MVNRQTIIAAKIFVASVLPIAGLAGPAFAQEALPWRLANYPAGGAEFSRIVAKPLVENADLLLPTCRALRPGTAEQAASGFAGIGFAIATSQDPVSSELESRVPDCCPNVANTDADTLITIGAQLALLAREFGDADIEVGRAINQLVRICDDDVLQSSYAIALGEDSLGVLIAQEGGGGPPTTGSIPTTSGGGVPSAN